MTSALNRRIRERDRRQGALLECLFKTSNPKVIGAFETMIAKQENDRFLLTDDLARDTQSTSPLGKIIELLRYFLSSPWIICEKCSLLVRKTIPKATFKAPLAHDCKRLSAPRNLQ